MSGGREIAVLEALRKLIEAEDSVVEARMYAGKMLNEPDSPLTPTQLAEITGMTRSKIYWLKKIGEQRENNAY